MSWHHSDWLKALAALAGTAAIVMSGGSATPAVAGAAGAGSAGAGAAGAGLGAGAAGLGAGSAGLGAGAMGAGAAGAAGGSTFGAGLTGLLAPAAEAGLKGAAATGGGLAVNGAMPKYGMTQVGNVPPLQQQDDPMAYLTQLMRQHQLGRIS